MCLGEPFAAVRATGRPDSPDSHAMNSETRSARLLFPYPVARVPSMSTTTIPGALMAQPLITPIGSSPPSPRRSLASACASRGRRALLAAASRALDSLWHRVSRPARRLARSSSAAEVQIDCAKTSVTSIRWDMGRVADDSVRQLHFGNDIGECEATAGLQHASAYDQRTQTLATARVSRREKGNL